MYSDVTNQNRARSILSHLRSVLYLSYKLAHAEFGSGTDVWRDQSSIHREFVRQ